MNLKKPVCFYLSAFLFFTIFLFSFIAKGQDGNPIIDAPALKAAIADLKGHPDSIPLAKKVLDYVNANSENPFASYKAMLDSLSKKKNKLLLNELPSQRNLTLDINEAKESAMVSTENAGAQSGMFTTGLIDAAGSFIAQRFKQEMEIAFLYKFREWMEDGGKIGLALRSLFPVTSKALLQNDPYQYTTFLEMLKEALKKDVTNIPTNIGVYLGNNPFGVADSSYYTALLIYNNVVLTANGQSPVLTLGNLNNDASLLAKNPKKVQSVIHLTSLISQLLTNPARPDEWINLNTIRANLNTTPNINLFFGLFMLKYENELRNITIDSKNLYTVMVENQTKLAALTALIDWIRKMGANYAILKETYKSINTAIQNGQDIPGSKIQEFGNGIANLLKTSLEFPFEEFSITIDLEISVKLDAITVVLKSFTELIANIKEKNYGLALSNALDMITLFIKDDTEGGRKTLSLIKKYGNFAVSVAKSDNKNEMLEALNTAALPVGSYRIKRNSYNDISLNAYAGIFGGGQTFSSSVPGGVKKANAIFGFTAPIGLAYSWGHTNNKDSLSGSSSTIFLSVVDIGAVTAFRLTQDSTKALPDLKWENLLAPGIFYVYGIKKLPVSCGLGVQYGPQVRQIKNDEAVILPSAWSIRLFIAIDIPFINFYTRTEKRK